MTRVELQVADTRAFDRPWRKDQQIRCPRCDKPLAALAHCEHYVCPVGHQFTKKQIVSQPAPPSGE